MIRDEFRHVWSFPVCAHAKEATTLENEARCSSFSRGLKERALMPHAPWHHSAEALSFRGRATHCNSTTQVAGRKSRPLHSLKTSKATYLVICHRVRIH